MTVIPRLTRDLTPLVVHVTFCALSAFAVRYSLASGNYAIVAGFPLVFLAAVVPILYFGWPPPFHYVHEPWNALGFQRIALVTLGALLTAYAVFSAIVFEHVLGAHADVAVFAVGGLLLYVAHARGRRSGPV